MRVVFSRDRAAQLCLLLQSLALYAPDDATEILWYASNHLFFDGYRNLDLTGMTEQADFDRDLRDLLEQDDTVTFFCDDDVVFRPLLSDPNESLTNDQVLTHSWRLGFPNSRRAPGIPWLYFWQHLPRHDHGYPGSIDGHTFRTADVLEMIGDEHIANPLILETVLALGCERLADRRPLMAAWPQQVLVGVPVNTVSDDTLRPNGQRHPQSAADLNDRFLAGGRIDLDALDFSDIDGCHHELEYVWRDG